MVHVFPYGHRSGLYLGEYPRDLVFRDRLRSKGGVIMYFGNVWDWNFFWQVFQNFLASGSPFVLIVVAASVVGILLSVVVRAVRGMGG